MNPIMEDWRYMNATMGSKMQFLLEKETLSDVKFVLENNGHIQTFYAHRLVMAANSPVFETMLYGPMAEKGEIYIPDIEVRSFSKMLRYFYSDDITIENLEDAMTLAYAATKYMVVRLREKCLEYLEQELSPLNACTIYEFAMKMDIDWLREKCLGMFVLHTKDVITSEDFMSASLYTVQNIVEREILAVPSESFLLNAVLLWGLEECSRQGHKELRMVVSSLLLNIRFLFMLPEQLVDINNTYCLLSHEELGSVLSLMYKPTWPTTPLPKIISNNEDTFKSVVWVENDRDFFRSSVGGEFHALDEKGLSLTVEVESGGLFVAGFCIVYKCQNGDLPMVGATVSLSTPGRFSGLKFFRRLSVSKGDGVWFVHFPRGVFLKEGESLGISVQFSNLTEDIACKMWTSDKRRFFSEDLNFSYVLKRTYSSTKMFFTRMIIAWKDYLFLRWN